jgi:hypothetical protein
VSVRLEQDCPRAGPDGLLEVLEAESPAALAAALPCAGGGEPHLLHIERLDASGGLRGCLACGHPELYTQKSFPRAAGIAIVVIAALLAPFTWYLSLVAAAALDALLWWLGPDVVVCYVCRARHRRFGVPPRHPRFDREIDERLRYGTRAVMGKPMRPGGTADAPEPEH